MIERIRNFQDILDILNRNPDYQDQMRRHILTQELLELPAIVQELARNLASLTDRVDRLADQVDSLTEQVTSLAQLLHGHIRATNEHFERVESHIGELKTDVTELKIGQAELKDGQDELRAGQARMQNNINALNGKMGEISGTPYERQTARRAPRLFRRYLGLQDITILLSKLVTEGLELSDILDEAEAENRITLEASFGLDEADIVARGEGADGETTYLVAEVSETIHSEDVRRARDRAATMAQAAEAPAIAVVIGRAVSQETLNYAEQNDVRVIRV